MRQTQFDLSPTAAKELLLLWREALNQIASGDYDWDALSETDIAEHSLKLVCEVWDCFESPDSDSRSKLCPKHSEQWHEAAKDIPEGTFEPAFTRYTLFIRGLE